MPMWGPRDNAEITHVNQETEVAIPWQTYVKDGIVSTIITAGFWLIVWLVFYQVKAATQRMSFSTWMNRYWGKWIDIWWPTVLIFFVLSWCGLSAWVYKYRLTIEQAIKNPPQYARWSHENGMWHPWVNRRVRRLRNREMDDTYRERYGVLRWGRDEEEGEDE